ncbi:MAG: ABC transporter permease [Candidatus Marinimicrobia bacterium]|nr:ABC transporter permease [Candidatus Neomarinimicrobiota bacterium]
MIFWFVALIGSKALSICNMFGEFVLFFFQTIGVLFTTKLRIQKLFAQMKHIGVDSLVIILLTGAFSGAVLALQSYIGFKRFGAEEFIGPVVALSLVRELGPVLTGLMVTGRAGSAIAAELGTMQITEQIDALKSLCINVKQYLVVPRILGGTIILPFLTAFSMIFGIIGGYVISVYVLGLNGEQYVSGIRTFVELSDITGGLIKASVFGLILSWVGCYKGYHTEGGARGVGLATTQSVVLSSILILISNYFLAALLFD